MSGRLAFEAALAVALGAAFLALFVANAQYTLFFDYSAYELAADRLLSGDPLYDLRFVTAGEFGLFFYPPPFVLLVVPFALLPGHLGEWLWLAGLVACGGAACLVMPVRPRVRIATAALMSTSWPFIFAVKVGQVGPILLLLFSLGWRLLDRPSVVGWVGAVGALIKIQPGLLLVWLAAVQRWRAVLVGAAVIAGGALLAMAVTGPGAWLDLVALMRGLQDPLTTPRNFAPGATAYFLGAPHAVAAIVQTAGSAMTLALVAVTARWATRDSSYLVAVVATQLVSPILWDHYAIVLLLPIAWLLERRQLWAALVPILQGPLLLNIAPPITWLGGYAAVVLAVALLGIVERRRAQPRPSPLLASA